MSAELTASLTLSSMTYQTPMIQVGACLIVTAVWSPAALQQQIAITVIKTADLG